jgi:hypothetical protein
MPWPSRRMFLGGALSLTLGPLACSNSSAPARDRIRKGAPGSLQPGARWTGVAGSGGEPPAQSDRPLGALVPDERFTGGFSAVPGQWVHGEGIRITALGLPPQPADGDAINYFKEALFFLEGNSVKVTDWSVNQTPVRMHDGRMAPQGSIGFSVEVGPGEGAVSGGDAILYCFLRGEHGLERRIEIPLVINVDRSLDARRRTVYVDPVAGNDDAAGTKVQPWRSLNRALSMGGASDGGRVVLMRAGNYVEDVNGTAARRSFSNGRMIEVVAAEGLKPEQVVITRTSRQLPETRWIVPARKVHFQGVTIDLGKMLVIQGGVRDYVLGFSGCRLVDPAGENGPRDASGLDIGYNLSVGPVPLRDAVNNPLPFGLGGVYLTECLFVNYTTQGARLYRNVTARESTDSFAGGPGYDNVVIDGFFVTMTRDFHARMHSARDLIVQSARKGDKDQTVVQLAGPPLFSGSNRRPDCKALIASGALAGRDGITVITADPATNSLVLQGDLAGSLAPGDRLRFYLIWHADFCQQQGIQRPDQTGMRNTTIFRYHASSPTAQLFLTGAGVRLEDKTVIATKGRQFLLSSASPRRNQLAPNDILKLSDGPQSGEYRFVESYDPATGTGTLLDPFSADQAGAALGRYALITGVTGQDGAYLSNFCSTRAYTVHGVKRARPSFNTGRIEHLYQDPHEQDPRFILHYGDLTDSTNLIRIVQQTQPDEIYNLAAQSHVQVSFETPNIPPTPTASGTLRLLEAIRILGLEKKTRFYQASTSELYGLVQEVPQSETTPFYPRSPYGAPSSMPIGSW